MLYNESDLSVFSYSFTVFAQNFRLKVHYKIKTAFRSVP
jgi:hypothetical protein